MKQSNERHTIAGQSNGAQKPHKHDANLQKNSTLYFQIGLIVCLLTVFGLFEMRFESKPIEVSQLPPIDDPDEIEIKNFKVFQEEIKKDEPVKETQKLGAKEPIIKENDFQGLENDNPIIDEPDVIHDPIDAGNIKVPKIIDEDLVDWVALEKVPVYPGCEKAKTNDQRKKCMSEKLAKLIQRNFDQGLISELEFSGTQKINVQFKIDKTGNITDIKAKAPHIELEKEALKVVNKIPTMEPGLQRAKPVSVMYYLPIILKVQ